VSHDENMSAFLIIKIENDKPIIYYIFFNKAQLVKKCAEKSLAEEFDTRRQGEVGANKYFILIKLTGFEFIKYPLLKTFQAAKHETILNGFL
jgi:hypothetical protein